MCELFIDGLSAGEIRAIEVRMRDRNFSTSGFLGTRESLSERIRADAAILRDIGITHVQIAERLEAIVREADRLRNLLRDTPEYQSRREALMLRALQEEDFSLILQEEREANVVLVEERFSVASEGYRGFQFCPFEYYHDDVSIRSCGKAYRDIEIRNTGNGTAIWFSELLIHTIRDHQFFEGEGVRYRLDPIAVVRALELKGV